jgi:hypothetical protein
VIHFPLFKARATVRFLHQANLYSSGAMSLGRWPLNHRSFQNLVLLPLPTEMWVHALNKALSSVLIGTVRHVQGFLGTVHRHHSHPQSLGSDDSSPVNLAISSSRFLRSMPKEISTNPFHPSDWPLRQREHGHMVEYHCCQDRIN